MRWVVASFCLAGAVAVVLVLCMRSTSAQAHEMVRNGAALVDVRTPEEYQSGHLPGAINIPVDEISTRASEIGANTRPVVTYCRSGARSGRAANVLRSLGFTNVVNLGPKAAW
jgi:phage shock protein E